MLDLETVHRGALGNDRLKQDTKRGNVPLAVAQRVQHAAARLFGIDLERVVKGPARRQHAQLFIEHDEGLRDRVDDRLREDLRVFDIAGGVQHDFRWSDPGDKRPRSAAA